MTLKTVLAGTSAAAILTLATTLGAAAQENFRGNAGPNVGAGVSQAASGSVTGNRGVTNRNMSGRTMGANGAANLRANGNIRTGEQFGSSNAAVDTRTSINRGRYAEGRGSVRFGRERFEATRFGNEATRFGNNERVGFDRDRRVDRDRYAMGYRRMGYRRDRDIDWRAGYGGSYGVGVAAATDQDDYYDYAPGYAYYGDYAPAYYDYAPGFSIGLYNYAPGYSAVGFGVGTGGCTCGGW
jgi:hypothetical protein